jgi:uncharacterized membrane protein HdeD (DUF308 family)
VRGIVALVLGVVFLIWPGVTIGTALALFAIFCFVDATVALVRLFSAGQPAGDRVLQILRVVVDVAAAVVVIAWPGPSAEVLTVVIGIYAIVIGVFELTASGALSRAGGQSTGWLVATGVLSILAGILLIVWTNIGAVTLAVVFGAYLAAYGIVMLVSAARAPKGGTVPSPVA